jgi:Zn-dependent M28 family amino/carboxypeptidase
MDKISNKIEANSVNLSGTLEFSILQNEEEKYTNNIVGYVPGTDPKLKNEFVAVGAHFDHLGISNGVVFNGADDDGSGTVGVLELAKAFAEENDNKRSILFVFHAAEEKGLFGSEYFTDNDSSILKNITAQINLDMIGRESIDTIYSVGSDKLSSELKSIVEKVNKETVNFVFNYQFDDPNDPERIYYRSDHYNYAKHGIPVVFFTDNMQVDYHKPTDDYDKIDFAKIKKTDELVYGIVKDLANLDHKLAVDKEEK